MCDVWYVFDKVLIVFIFLGDVIWEAAFMVDDFGEEAEELVFEWEEEYF